MRTARQEERKKELENNEMAISPYLIIIILNINGLNSSSKDIDWLKGFLKIGSNNMLTTGDSIQFLMSNIG